MSELSWETRKGLVAFVDILGGASLYRSQNDTDIRKLEAYRSCVDELYPTSTTDRNVIGFSDCVYIIQDVTIIGRTFPKQAIDFLNNLSKFMTKCMVNGVPVKGGVSYGEVHIYVDSDYTMLRGVPVVQSYSLEQKQNWCGIAFVPIGFVKRDLRGEYNHIIRSASQGTPCFLRKFNIPTEDGLTELDALTWHNDCMRSAFAVVQKIHDTWSKKRNRRRIAERIEQAQKILAKYPATIDFIKVCLEA